MFESVTYSKLICRALIPEETVSPNLSLRYSHYLWIFMLICEYLWIFIFMLRITSFKLLVETYCALHVRTFPHMFCCLSASRNYSNALGLTPKLWPTQNIFPSLKHYLLKPGRVVFKNATLTKIGNIISSKLLFYQNKIIFLTLHKKCSFPFRISSVNVTKSAENCRFGHIYWRNP